MTSPTKPFAHQSKTQALSEHLGILARSLGPDAKLPTVQELKTQLKVSVATLDSALAHLESQKIIYRKHGVGIFVSPQAHQKSVALVCDPAFFGAGTSPFWPQLIEGVRLRAASKDESFRFYLALPSNRSDLPVPDDLIEDVCAKRVDGVLFVGNNKPAVGWISQQKLPVVGFAGWAPHTVALDYEQLIRLAVERLVEQGCRDIGFITWQRPAEGQQLQMPTGLSETFRQTLEEKGLPFSPDHIGASAATEGTVAAQSAESKQEQGFEATMRLLNCTSSGSPLPLQGLVVPDDLMTRGVLAALARLNLRPGKDICIATHANHGSPILERHAEELSLIEFDPAQVVQAMFDTLELLMDGRKPANADLWIAPVLAS